MPKHRTFRLRFFCAFLTSGLAFAHLLPAHGQVSGHRKRRGAIKSYKKKEKKSAPVKIPADQSAQKEGKDWFGTVTRGNMNVTIRTQGVVRAEDVFRLKSTIEGRVEEVYGKPMMWFSPKKNLATILNKELAAIMDSKATTPSSVMSDRWDSVYQTTPIECPDECFILRAYAQKKRWVEPGALLFEAARKLRMIGRIPPGYGRFIENGQIVTFWDVKNPRKKLQAKIEKFVLDIQGRKVESAGTFTMRMTRRIYLDPGTKWEGVIKTQAKRDILRVPTEALIIVDDQTFLPIRVSTGITTDDYTEITAGAAQNETFLYLEKAKDVQLLKHVPPPIVLESPDTGRRIPETMNERKDSPRRRRKRKAREIRAIDSFPEDETTTTNEGFQEEFPSDIPE